MFISEKKKNIEYQFLFVTIFFSDKYIVLEWFAVTNFRNIKSMIKILSKQIKLTVDLFVRQDIFAARFSLHNK